MILLVIILFLLKISSLLIEGVFFFSFGVLGLGVVINTWPVKPFEAWINGCTLCSVLL